MKRRSIRKRLAVAFISGILAALMGLTVWEDGRVLRGDHTGQFTMLIHLARAVGFGFFTVALAGLSFACLGDVLLGLLNSGKVASQNRIEDDQTM